MFTGIISAVSPVIKAEADKRGLKLTIGRPSDWPDLVLGESVSVNGTCLTVTEIKQAHFSCQLVPETLSKTSFGISEPKVVNLERALKASERLSGHFVLGHVDEVGRD